MPITFVGYKPTISSSGRLLGHHRSRLHFTLLEAIICTRSWIKDDINYLDKTTKMEQLKGIFSALIMGM
ncbi:hypothetical protein LINPERPRIM_LOCUS28114 [Linum perenne]